MITFLREVHPTYDAVNQEWVAVLDGPDRPLSDPVQLPAAARHLNSCWSKLHAAARQPKKVA